MTNLNNVTKILHAAHHAPSADNSQPWKFIWHNPTLNVMFDADRVGSYTFPATSPATILTMGAVLENICQAAFASNCHLDIQIPKVINPDKPLFFKIEIDQPEVACVFENDFPLFKRHTNRFPFQKSKIPFEVIEVLKKLTEGSARVVVFDRPNQIQEISSLVKIASQIRFRTRELHEWLAKSFRFDSYADDGLDISTLDLPPGGKYFLKLISSWKRMLWLNKIGAYKFLAGIDAGPISDAPALVAIISSCEYQDVLSAGRLMDRVWIDSNSNGLAVQPYFVVADQLHRRKSDQIPAELVSEADDLFKKAERIFQFNNDEALQMLFRIGYPTKTPVLSKRVPLDKVLEIDAPETL